MIPMSKKYVFNYDFYMYKLFRKDELNLNYELCMNFIYIYKNEKLNSKNPAFIQQ